MSKGANRALRRGDSSVDGELFPSGGSNTAGQFKPVDALVDGELYDLFQLAAWAERAFVSRPLQEFPCGEGEVPLEVELVSAPQSS